MPGISMAASRFGWLAARVRWMRCCEQYRSHPDRSPSAEALQRAAVTLQHDGDETGARAVLEFVYDREIRNGHLEAANFLGLAEVKLQRGDAATAVALVNRMALVVEDGFETLLPAAELLGKYGKTAESAEFIRRRMKAAPWDSEAKVQLARTLPPVPPSARNC
jgi:thioredoxin-like negative regulator of GroEL